MTNGPTWLTDRFEEKRGHLHAVAYRMLGSATEADDAVQETWLRLSRSETSAVENLGGWLTTVIARVCLDLLRSRKARREEVLEHETIPDEPAVPHVRPPSAEQEALLADSISAAMLLVLDTLAPAERVAFVLHDMFDFTFDEIASIVGRSPVATRQLASRARRRVQASPATDDGSVGRNRTIVDAFLAASRIGDFQALLGVLAPDVVLRADQNAVLTSAARRAQGAPALTAETRGAARVAEVFSGRAAAARPALVDGQPGAAFAPGGIPRFAFAFTIESGRITGIDIVSDPDRISRMDIVVQ